MRSDRLYRADIAESVDAIDRFLAGIDRDAFLASDLHRSAVLHKLSLIGEAATRLSAGLKARYPQVPWKPIAGFRNIAVHAYFAVDWDIVWNTATIEAPALRAQVSEIMAREIPDSDAP